MKYSVQFVLPLRQAVITVEMEAGWWWWEIH